jgi:hypothetical protein
MNTVLRSRQRAEEFAALVDGTVPPLREVKPGHDRHDMEVDRLVGIVSVMRREAAENPLATPSESFALDLRERLMTEAEVVLSPKKAVLTLPPRTHGKRERRLVAVATAAVVFAGTAGMAAAAQNSLPGEALYPIKRGIESAQVDLATSPSSRGDHLLDQAGDRLVEVQGLVAAGPATGAPRIPGTLDEFTEQAREGADLLLNSYADTKNPETVASVRDFAARDLTILKGLAQTAPPDARSALQQAATALAAIDSRASEACPACSDLPALQVPKTFLVTTDVDRAMKAIDSAHLNNDHPVVASRDAVKQADKQQGGSAKAGTPKSRGTPLADPSGGTGSGSTTGSGSSVGGQVGGLLKKPASKLKLPGGKSTGSSNHGSTGGSGGSGSNLGDLGAGLGDAVETLLPDVPGLPHLP